MSGAGPMILSAIIFGFFGFWLGPFSTTSVVTGQFLLYVAMFNWVMRGSAVAFAVCAALTFINKIIANAVYAIVGLFGAILFIIIAIMDLADPSTLFSGAPFVLFIFAAWNGYGSWSGLKEVLAHRSAAAARNQSTFSGPVSTQRTI